VPDLEAAVLGTPEVAFAGYPAPFVFDVPDGDRIEHTIWGDYIGLTGATDGDWVAVRARGVDGWMRATDVQRERLLEVNFVDVGQGDGCFIVTPEDRYLLVDAGEFDNMLRFLSWRFNLRAHPGLRIAFEAGVITHPDQDHYGGFAPLLRSQDFTFRTLYHNGLVDRRGDHRFGATVEVDGVTYHRELVTDLQQLHSIVDDPDLVGRFPYPNLLKTAVEEGGTEDVRMLAAGSNLPGYGEDEDLSIAVLAPVTTSIGGAPALRRLGDDGVTKNGHSVTLRLRYRNISVLLTGDLNARAQAHLLRHYTGSDPEGLDAVERARMIQAARRVLASDAAKGCHHGSADFLEEFLASIDALVTVVSSGDDEPFAHPRPDALGAIGRWGRGPRPLIFSTELARSPRENVKEAETQRAELARLTASPGAAATDLERARLDRDVDERLARLERAIAVYGLINLRTDGERLLVAQKLERPSPSGAKWDVHCFELRGGELTYVPER
jgi:beta-lactamase superfamily II metal-dependent hydrolase